MITVTQFQDCFGSRFPEADWMAHKVLPVWHCCVTDEWQEKQWHDQPKGWSLRMLPQMCQGEMSSHFNHCFSLQIIYRPEGSVATCTDSRFGERGLSLFQHSALYWSKLQQLTFMHVKIQKQNWLCFKYLMNAEVHCSHILRSLDFYLKYLCIYRFISWWDK